MCAHEYTYDIHPYVRTLLAMHIKLHRCAQYVIGFTLNVHYEHF